MRPGPGQMYPQQMGGGNFNGMPMGNRGGRMQQGGRGPQGQGNMARQGPPGPQGGPRGQKPGQMPPAGQAMPMQGGMPMPMGGPGAPPPAQMAPQEITASSLAAAAPEQQKQLLGERLFPLIHNVEPQLAGKITGMLLEMDNGELLNLLESPDALNAKIMEAISVLQMHADGSKEE